MWTHLFVLNELTNHAVVFNVWGPPHNWMDYDDSILQMLYYDGEYFDQGQVLQSVVVIALHMESPFFMYGESYGEP